MLGWGQLGRGLREGLERMRRGSGRGREIDGGCGVDDWGGSRANMVDQGGVKESTF